MVIVFLYGDTVVFLLPKDGVYHNTLVMVILHIF